MKVKEVIIMIHGNKILKDKLINQKEKKIIMMTIKHLINLIKNLIKNKKI